MNLMTIAEGEIRNVLDTSGLTTADALEVLNVLASEYEMRLADEEADK